MAETSPGATTSADSPSATMSAMPPMCVVTSGAPSAIASRTVVGQGSGHWLGSTAASAWPKLGQHSLVPPLLVDDRALGQRREVHVGAADEHECWSGVQ